MIDSHEVLKMHDLRNALMFQIVRSVLDDNPIVEVEGLQPLDTKGAILLIASTGGWNEQALNLMIQAKYIVTPQPAEEGTT